MILLAGCISDDPKPADQATLSPSADLGLVTGDVLDVEQRPIADADVGLRGANLITKTDASGRFYFSDVQPGNYVIDVAKLGYAPGAREVTVKAGEELTVELQLVAIVIPDAAYYLSHPFTGILDCAFGSEVWVSPCSYPYTAAFFGARDGFCVEPPACTPPVVNLSQYGAPEDIQNNQWRYNFTVLPDATNVVSEMVWTPTSAAASKMMLVLSCPKYDPVWDDCIEEDSYADVAGTSPLRKSWKVEGKVDPNEWVMSRTYLPFQDVQVALQQKFDVWNTVWYNQESPEGWSILTESS